MAGTRAASLLVVAVAVLALLNFSVPREGLDWRQRPEGVAPQLWTEYVEAIDRLGQCVESRGWAFPTPVPYPEDGRYLVYGVAGATDIEEHKRAKSDLAGCRDAGFDVTFDEYYDAVQ